MDLPDELALPLATGEAWWYWLGGRPSLDLVNTLRERWWRNVETLVTPDDLAAWLQRADLLTAGAPDAASQPLLASARELREAIDAGIVAAVGGAEIPAGCVETVDSWLPAAALAPTLEFRAGRDPLLRTSEPADRLEHALGLVALDAARLLGTEERERARICASQTCSARFYDRSPTAGRLWCSMRGCGNVAKARRHRERARAER